MLFFPQPKRKRAECKPCEGAFYIEEENVEYPHSRLGEPFQYAVISAGPNNSTICLSLIVPISKQPKRRSWS
jgi:hypothetical protein